MEDGNQIALLSLAGKRPPAAPTASTAVLSAVGIFCGYSILRSFHRRSGSSFATVLHVTVLLLVLFLLLVAIMISMYGMFTQELHDDASLMSAFAIGATACAVVAWVIGSILWSWLG